MWLPQLLFVSRSQLYLRQTLLGGGLKMSIHQEAKGYTPNKGQLES